jgi:hypothetical protein
VVTKNILLSGLSIALIGMLGAPPSNASPG